jgi:ketosteroid isomerase-like protein
MDLKELCHKHFELFSNKDIDGLAELYDDNIVLRDWQYFAEGKSAVLSTVRGIFNTVDSILVTPLALYQDANTVAAELEILINGAETILVTDVITFTDDKISSIKAYKG